MRRRQLKWLWARLAELQDMTLTRDALLMKLGSAQSKVPSAWRLIDITVDVHGTAFSYRLNRTKLKPLAPGLTARSALEKFAAMQMVDVHIPTTGARELMLTRYTQPEPELVLLLERLNLELPAQPPPKITAAQAATARSL